jgi:putative hemolysin
MILKKTLVGILALVLVLGACGDDDEDQEMANPASVYCIEQGGTLDIRSDAEGNQYGVCVFADGSECGEWAYYHGECAPGEGAAELPNPASVYCIEQGGTLDIRSDAEGNQYGVCVFADGSECEEWAFFRGECAPGG